MPLEIYRFMPEQPVRGQWKKVCTVYPGEEVQIPSFTPDGQLEMMRVIVKPDDSMSTVHTIFPTEIIIRDALSGLPSQIEFDPKQSRNLPTEVRKGQYTDVFSRMLIERSEGRVVAEIARGRLYHR